MEKCRICGRFLARVKKALSTGFPPGDVAYTYPHAPFVCMNHGKYGWVEYKPIQWEVG